MNGIEESQESLAFATEPVMVSLANVMAARQEGADKASDKPSANSTGQDGSSSGGTQVKETVNYIAKDYDFLDIELKYGLLQVRRDDDDENGHNR
jgi:SCY1-like protein 2